MEKRRTPAVILIAASVSAAIGLGFLLLAAEVTDTSAQARPTPVPTTDPAQSPPPPLPRGPLPPTPPPPPPNEETRAEANRRVIESLGPGRKVELTRDVVAILLPTGLHSLAPEVLLYDFPTDSQLFIDQQGRELRRFINDPAAARRLEEVLADTSLRSRALALLP